MIQSLHKLVVYLSCFILLGAFGPRASLAGESPTPSPVGPVGEWLGALEVGATKLRLGLHVETKAEGGLGAVLDSLDQGAKIPVATTTFEGGTLRLAIPGIGASYEGTLNAEGSSIQGAWSQGGRSLPLTFQRQAAAAALNRPQLPKGPFPYESREAAFQSGAGKVHLAGTLLLPHGKGPFPAVILINGSGAQDRDESLMGHKPFLVIADALARRGIASLRWDDRGTGSSTGNTLGSTVDDLVADARAALAFLRTAPEVDGRKIGIVGHSEGGLIGPIVASQERGEERGVAFLVLLAPPGEPLRSLLLRQTRDLFRLQGIDGSLAERYLAVQAEYLDLAADPALSVDRLVETLRARSAVHRKEFSDEERARLRIDAPSIEQAIQTLTTPWLRSLVRQDPAVSLRNVKVPVLALFGDKDFQVEARVNADAVRTALLAARNPDHQERTLPGLNHLFQHAGTGAMDEYGAIEETFAPEALSAIGDWIGERFARKGGEGKGSLIPGATPVLDAFASWE